MAYAMEEKSLLQLLKPIGICFICIMKKQPRNTGPFKKLKNVKEDPEQAEEKFVLFIELFHGSYLSLSIFPAAPALHRECR